MSTPPSNRCDPIDPLAVRIEANVPFPGVQSAFEWTAPRVAAEAGVSVRKQTLYSARTAFETFCPATVGCHPLRAARLRTVFVAATLWQVMLLTSGSAFPADVNSRYAVRSGMSPAMYLNTLTSNHPTWGLF